MSHSSKFSTSSVFLTLLENQIQRRMAELMIVQPNILWFMCGITNKGLNYVRHCGDPNPGSRCWSGSLPKSNWFVPLVISDLPWKFELNRPATFFRYPINKQINKCWLKKTQHNLFQNEFCEWWETRPPYWHVQFVQWLNTPSQLFTTVHFWVCVCVWERLSKLRAEVRRKSPYLTAGQKNNDDLCVHVCFFCTGTWRIVSMWPSCDTWQWVQRDIDAPPPTHIHPLFKYCIGSLCVSSMWL